MSSDEKFQFVSRLAIDLNRGDVKLPSFPDIVIRIRSALDDPDCSAERLADLIGTEPTLASRILIYANSAHYNPTGAKIVSLPNAISRLGFKQLRSVAVTYAVEQLQLSESMDALRNELRTVWQHSLRTGAMAEALSTKVRGVDMESAFLAGLLSGIGTLYVFHKHNDFPGLISDPEQRAELIAEWGGPIGESILSSWEFPEEIVETANINIDDLPPAASPGLTHVVLAAREVISANQLDLEGSESVQRLGLSESHLEIVGTRFESRLASLSSAIAA